MPTARVRSEPRAFWDLNKGEDVWRPHGPSRWQSPLARLLTNQVLIEMAIQELVTVSVVNVNLTQPIRRTTKRSSRETRSRTANATVRPEDNRFVRFRRVRGVRSTTHSIKFHLARNIKFTRQGEWKDELTVNGGKLGGGNWMKNISSRPSAQSVCHRARIVFPSEEPSKP